MKIPTKRIRYASGFIMELHAGQISPTLAASQFDQPTAQHRPYIQPATIPSQKISAFLLFILFLEIRHIQQRTIYHAQKTILAQHVFPSEGVEHSSALSNT